MKKPPNYAAYIKSTRWRNICELMKRRANFVCDHCKKSAAVLEVHHKTYERLGRERMSDLEVLCKPCHDGADRKRIEKREEQGAQRAYEIAIDTYVAKKYGDYAIGHPGMEEEFEEWVNRKSYCESWE